MTHTRYHVKPISILCEDNTRLSATLFTPVIQKTCGTVVICAALGVGQAFYHEFSAYLCGHGYHTLTFDYRGTGASRNPDNNHSPRLLDWALQDISALIDYAAALPGPDRIYLVGHSVGGQIFCLAQQAEQLTGAVLVAASFPFWRRWRFPRKWLMFLFFYILTPVLCLGRKNFPTKMLGLAKENIPVSLFSDWARWTRHPDYVTADKFNIDTKGFGSIRVPMLSYSFSDDMYAPERAVQRLLKAFTNAVVTKIHIDTENRDTGGIGHFGFFKKQTSRDLWEKTLSWMECKPYRCKSHEGFSFKTSRLQL